MFSLVQLAFGRFVLCGSCMRTTGWANNGMGGEVGGRHAGARRRVAIDGSGREGGREREREGRPVEVRYMGMGI